MNLDENKHWPGRADEAEVNLETEQAIAASKRRIEELKTLMVQSERLIREHQAVVALLETHKRG